MKLSEITEILENAGAELELRVKGIAVPAEFGGGESTTSFSLNVAAEPRALGILLGLTRQGTIHFDSDGSRWGVLSAVDGQVSGM